MLGFPQKYTPFRLIELMGIHELISVPAPTKPSGNFQVKKKKKKKKERKKKNEGRVNF